mmetsp:Transcript_35209/g.77050  ORF Transcript_35209/g.77050 Transcript_35209/m.77050 type:complete len:102 (+) Transcript_35209:32-337(+)
MASSHSEEAGAVDDDLLWAQVDALLPTAMGRTHQVVELQSEVAKLRAALQQAEEEKSLIEANKAAEYDILLQDHLKNEMTIQELQGKLSDNRGPVGRWVGR